MNPTTSTTTSTTITTSSTAPSLLRQLLSTPSASSTPTFDDLLARPGPSSAPPPTFDELITRLSPSSALQPSPIIVEEEPPVIHLPDDEEWGRTIVSTAFPNFWDPELHQVVMEEVLGTAEYRLPSPSPRSMMGSPLPPPPTTLVSPFPPSPPLSTSPPSSPPPQLPARRKQFNRLRLNTAYKVKEWRQAGGKLELTIFNTEQTALYITTLPKNIHRPTKKLRLHHLFDNNLHLTITKQDGKLNFTFHP